MIIKICKSTVLLLVAASVTQVNAWSLPQQQSLMTRTSDPAASTTALEMANPYNSNEFLKWAKDKRSADAGDNVVELNRPLGIVLNQDPYGNVYVETVAPNGNAARSGQVCRIFRVTLIFVVLFIQLEIMILTYAFTYCHRSRKVILLPCAVQHSATRCGVHEVSV